MVPITMNEAISDCRFFKVEGSCVRVSTLLVAIDLVSAYGFFFFSLYISKQRKATN